MIKKILRFFTVFWFVIIFYALTLSPTHGEVSPLEDFRPKVLPTNPFYLVKNLKRGFDRFLTLSSKGKLELDLRISEEKTQEINALFRSQKTVPDEIEKHLIGFSRDLKGLKKDLTVFKEKNSKNHERTLGMVFDSVLAEHRVFESLEAEFNSFKETLQKVRNELMGVMVLMSGLDGSFFKNQLNELIEEARGANSQFKLVKFLSELERIPDLYKLKTTLNLKNDLIWDLEGNLRSLSDEERNKFFDGLRPLTASSFLAFEDIRDILTDTDLKSRFNSLRKKEIDMREMENSFGEEETNAIIKLVEAAIISFEKESAENEKFVSKETARRIIEQAQINLEQAQKFFIEGRFGAALPQAMAARAMILNGFSQILEGENQDETIRLLRIEFDKLKNEAKNKDRKEENDPRLYSFFNEAEKYLVAPKSVEDLRKAKVILSELGNLLANY